MSKKGTCIRHHQFLLSSGSACLRTCEREYHEETLYQAFSWSLCICIVRISQWKALFASSLFSTDSSMRLDVLGWMHSQSKVRLGHEWQAREPLFSCASIPFKIMSGIEADITRALSSVHLRAWSLGGGRRECCHSQLCGPEWVC